MSAYLFQVHLQIISTMPNVTDIRIHQETPQLEVAFDNGEVYRLPYAIKALEPVGHTAVKLTFTDGRQVRYDWQQLYAAAQQTSPGK